jgi:hypothetical protein
MKTNDINKFEDKLNNAKDEYNKLLPELKNEKYTKNFNCLHIDIPRTLNEEFIKNNPSFASNLEELLKVFIISNNNGNYISGMTYIAKLVLKYSNNNKYNAFILLKNIFEEQFIKEMYEDNYKNILDKFKQKLKEKMPILFQHFEKNKIDLNFGPYWLKTLLNFNFGDKIAEYVFNIYMKNRDFDIYISAIIAILKGIENDLLKKNDMELLAMLHKNEIDYDKFVEKMGN